MLALRALALFSGALAVCFASITPCPSLGKQPPIIPTQREPVPFAETVVILESQPPLLLLRGGAEAMWGLAGLEIQEQGAVPWPGCLTAPRVGTRVWEDLGSWLNLVGPLRILPSWVRKQACGLDVCVDHVLFFPF